MRSFKDFTYPERNGRINLLHRLGGQRVQDLVKEVHSPQTTVFEHHIRNVDDLGDFRAAMNSVQQMK